MPRHRRATALSRAGTSIDPTANRHPQTNLRREQLLARFQRWLLAELSVILSDLKDFPLLISTALVAYGKCLFYEGIPKYQMVETLNSVVDALPHLRGQLGAVWGLISKWQEQEPIERTMVMPASVFRAAVALALLWDWPLFAAALLLGFHGLLRPNEFLTLKRKHLVLPRDILSNDQICYVAILHSKTRRYVLRQHARISDEVSVGFLDAVFGCYPADSFLFGCSLSVFRNRWGKLFGHLGIPTSEAAKGITPKSLRGSGASWLYHVTEDVGKVLWRGRWQSRKTLEHYLQDIQGQVLLSDLVKDKRQLVFTLASAASGLLLKASKATPLRHGDQSWISGSEAMPLEPF